MTDNADDVVVSAMDILAVIDTADTQTHWLPGVYKARCRLRDAAAAIVGERLNGADDAR